MAPLPIVMGPQGPVPRTPAALRAALTELVSSTNPGYINNLPSSIIEDIASTDVGALIVQDQFMVDTINSVTPHGANAFLLNQLGTDIYGIQPANAANTSVDLIFYDSTPGFIIIPGFTVTDNTYQYICIDGGVIGTNGESLPIHAVATISGSWAVPTGTVTGFITSVPSNIRLNVTNVSDGIPAIASETIQSFRKRTLTAGLAASTGMDRYLKTLLWNIPGVVQRLVSVRQDLDECKWVILVGGGDPYQVAWAIYYALFDISSLSRPTIDIVNITNDNPILITTLYNHNFVNPVLDPDTGLPSNPPMQETITGVVGMEWLNHKTFSVTVINDKQFTIPVDGTTLGKYVSGGIVSPNPILQEITINSYPDSYIIPFILPAQQLVTMVVTWQTDSPNYISAQSMAQLANPALVDYINNLYVGVTPLNIYEMQSIFLRSCRNIVDAENIVFLDFTVAFDGVGQSVAPGSGVIIGDPNSYFYTTTNNISIVQAP
jgi:hypothetical protein